MSWVCFVELEFFRHVSVENKSQHRQTSTKKGKKKKDKKKGRIFCSYTPIVSLPFSLIQNNTYYYNRSQDKVKQWQQQLAESNVSGPLLPSK